MRHSAVANDERSGGRGSNVTPETPNTEKNNNNKKKPTPLRRKKRAGEGTHGMILDPINQLFLKN
jgi:hypothetical protein